MNVYDDNKMRRLVKKYFEGQTSLDDEATLRVYFTGEAIAADLKPLQPVFLYFSRERAAGGGGEMSCSPSGSGRPARKSARRLIRVWTGIAAACALLIIGINHDGKRRDATRHVFTDNTSIAYIDGKQCTDIHLICSDALDALDALTGSDKSAVSVQIQAIEDLTMDIHH